MTQKIFNVAMVLAVTLLLFNNFTAKAFADTNCIGDEDAFVCVDTVAGTIRIQGVSLITQGPDGPYTNMSGFYISGDEGKIGTVNSTTPGTAYLKFNSEDSYEGIGEITSSAYFYYPPYDPERGAKKKAK